MLYKTHITTWYTVASWLTLLTGVFNPIIFLAVPLFSLLADADHNKWTVAQTLGLKFWFLWHRWILHSWLGLLIVNIIFISIFVWIITLLWLDVHTFNFYNTVANFDLWRPSSVIQVLAWYTTWLVVTLWVLWLIYNILWYILNKFLWKGISNLLLSIISLFLFFWFLYVLSVWYEMSANMPLINIFFGLYILLLSHLVWDYFTNTGFPFFYPFSKRRIKSPITFSTGKSIEKLILVILTIVNIWLLVKIFHAVDTWTIVHFSTSILIFSALIFTIIFTLLFWSDLNIFKQIKKISGNVKGMMKTLLSMVLWIIVFAAWIFWVLYAYLSSNIQTSNNTILLWIGSLIWLFVLLNFLYKKFIKNYSYLYFITVSTLFIYIIIYSILGIMINTSILH